MIEVEPGEVLELVLARPERRNALVPSMLEAVATLPAESLEGARAVLLRGEGKAFCAGFDLELCANEQGAMRTLLEGLSRAVEAMRSWEVPVVACVQGAAVAGGCALLGGADVVVAAKGAKLGYPVAKLGVSPAVTAPFLRLAVGDGAARELLLEPELIDADRALELGLVHEVVADAGAALVRARELARSLAAKPAVGVRSTRRWLGELDGLEGPPEAVRRGLEASLALAGGPEERSRVASALERRRG